MVDFEICPGPIHCEGCAGNAELIALRAERDKWMADHSRQYSIAAAYAVERDALRAERDALNESADALSDRWDGLVAERDAIRAELDKLRAKLPEAGHD